MPSSTPRLGRFFPLLFLSGFSALLYQTTWLREFRLVFGATTSAAAAVLGIFMGGLGLGSAILGKRAETKERPLEYYARLELMIALSAGLSPVLLWVVRHIYLAMGGTFLLGTVWGTALRLVLSALAIGGPAFLMGGTLPAVLRAAVPGRDTSRKTVAMLYGMNTFGAVVGTLGATFFLFERFGNHATIGLAAAANIVVALAARRMSRLDSERPAKTVKVSEKLAESRAPAGFVYVAAGTTGFVFLLMEIVWYRMLIPLLGASAFVFGLILAVALLGIGLGGLLYALFDLGKRRSLNRFAFICALQATLMALPFALGDRIALTTQFLRALGSFGFYGHVLGWTIICAIVVLPASIMSGLQFPMLISLLGQGSREVGVQTGRTYAWNAGGAILGSLAGGFALLPVFSAPGVWKFSVVLLCLLAAGAVIVQSKRDIRNWIGAVPSLSAVVLALGFLQATGPTAFWRHSQIGVGRIKETENIHSANGRQDMFNYFRRDIWWETDGVESSVALSNSHGLSFVVNGRSDGHSKHDAGTQIMLGMIPAALYPQTERALVIGLGSGSTAGWLAAIPQVREVDVVELEPAMRRVAEACADVNHGALRNPKVSLHIGDGREFILTTRNKYGLIASEPSNPYRAGIASLYTREYYQAVAGALTPDGVFAQWVQAYEVDAPTFQTIYATLKSVFPDVETWQTEGGDILLVAARSPRIVNVTALRERLELEPFRSAVRCAWDTTDLEGFLAHFVADDWLARAMSTDREVPLNTDDRTVIEFAFGRSVSGSEINLFELRNAAKQNRADHPKTYAGEIDWQRVEQRRLAMLAGFGELSGENGDLPGASRARAYSSYAQGNLELALSYWRQETGEPEDLLDFKLLAECLAKEKDNEALRFVEELRKESPIEADAILSNFFLQNNELEKATQRLEKTFTELRRNPWPADELINRTLAVALEVASRSSALAGRIYAALEQPFSVFSSEEERCITLVEIGRILDQDKAGRYSLGPIERIEPNIPWQEQFLELRAQCYRNAGSPRLAQAEKDLTRFRANQPASLNSPVQVEGHEPPARGYATEKHAP